MKIFQKWLCLLLTLSLLFTAAAALDVELPGDEFDDDDNEGDIIWETTESEEPTEPSEPSEEGCPFTDVSPTSWSYEAISYVYHRGLMNGTAATTFSPASTMTRAMLVTVLWRCEGMPMDGEAAFTDVPDNTWYSSAVAWAAANGIVTGVGNGRFAPNHPITREQMVAILYRYSGYTKRDITARASLSGFTDSAQVSAWAVAPMQWAVAEKLINGMDHQLKPQGSAAREQVAAVLMRFFETANA